MLAKLQFIAFVIAVTGLLIGRMAVAQEVRWDPSVYDALVPADSSDTIEPGTKITLQNWQRYKRFMSYGIQIQYSGRYFWHVGSTPDFTITVGPTRPIRLPKQILLDTEKYAGQAKLEKVDTGGYTLEGFVAGFPFPNPTAPEMATKIVYNARYPAVPAVTLYSQHNYVVDKFLNLSEGENGLAVYRLSHLSVAGMPINPAYGTGYEYGLRIFLTALEQARYLTQITLWPDDPGLPQEIYVFLPEFRRPLRLSSAARCAPILGGDFVNDDTGLIVTNFSYKILGEKKILVLLHPTSDPAVLYNADSTHMKSSLPGWPMPALGQWELRDVYVLDFMPLPVMGRYCYGHRVAYIDKETWAAIQGDIYDADGKLWKISVGAGMVIPDNARDGEYLVGQSGALLNLRETHATGSIINTPVKVDNEVPEDYRDAPVAAFPNSLHSIMR